MTTMRYIFLCIPTALLVFLTACAGQRPPTAEQTAAVTSIDAVNDNGETNVRFDDGVIVRVRPGRQFDEHGVALAHPTEMEATSSDGTTASMEHYRGVPIVHYGELRGALFMSADARAELAKWQARGNTAALAVVSVVVANTAAVAGVTVDELVSPYGPAAPSDPTSPLMPSAAACEQDVDQPEIFDFPEEECRVRPGDATLVAIAQGGWYPCVRDTILALISALGTYWFCGGCITFLYSVIPGILGYASNPVGWVAALLGAGSCILCALSAWSEFSSARDALINCFNNHPPPQR